MVFCLKILTKPTKSLTRCKASKQLYSKLSHGCQSRWYATLMNWEFLKHIENYFSNCSTHQYFAHIRRRIQVHNITKNKLIRLKQRRTYAATKFPNAANHTAQTAAVDKIGPYGIFRSCSLLKPDFPTAILFNSTDPTNGCFSKRFKIYTNCKVSLLGLLR